VTGGSTAAHGTIGACHAESAQKTMIRLVLVGILLLLSLSFFLHNQEQEVTLRYFFGQLSASTPIYKPILSAFAIGLLVASILLFPALVRGRIELRRKTKALQETEADLEELRQSLGKLSPQPANPSEEELRND
jgi:lipopolysaccharide assembly protein A